MSSANSGVRADRAHLDTATSPRPDLPLLLWRRGLGRGGRPVGKPLPPRSANPSMPPPPTPSPPLARGGGGENLGGGARSGPAKEREPAFFLAGPCAC